MDSGFGIRDSGFGIRDSSRARVDASNAITETVAVAYCSYVFASIPVGGCTSVRFAPISAQLVDSTVPPLS